MLFPKKSLFFLLISLLLFNFFILSIQSYSYIWYKAFSYFLSPVIKLIHNITKFFSNLFFSIKELREAKEENKILKEKIMWQNLRIGRLLLENIYLKQLYEFDNNPKYFEYVEKAHIIKMDAPSFSSKLVLSKGKTEGIKENYICITPEGLVGRILKAETVSSELLPIVNIESVVSGVTERTGIHGVLKGDGSGFLELKYLPPYSDIIEKDNIYTDCWDLIYPYGIKIGTIEEIKREVDEISAKVKPAVDFTKLSFVYIIRGAKD